MTRSLQGAGSGSNPEFSHWLWEKTMKALLTLIKGACQPVPKEWHVVCFPPTTGPRSSWRKSSNAPPLVLFLYKTVPPPIPGRARSNCQLYVFLQCPSFGTARYYSIAIPKEGHVGGKHTLQRPGFDFVLSPFSHRKRSYFEVLINFKKIRHTICDPFLILK